MTEAIAAVLVTHNSQRDLPETLASIQNQTVQPDIKVAIDDSSNDNIPALLTEAGFTVIRATSQARDIRTRIAHNFLQGLRASMRAGAEFVVLGDHDDIWHANRIGHQIDLLRAHPSIAMVASDGYLINEDGVALPGTIRETFPVPENFPAWPPRKQIVFALRHSLATGGASALHPTALMDWSVPRGWLHDRWWSLQALRAGVLLIDRVPVIDYRISQRQEVGLDTAGQEHGVRWIAGKVRQTGRSGRRIRDIARSFT